MASANRNSLAPDGTRFPSSDNTPIEKAMSVAMGTAQPRIAPGSPALKAT